MGALPRGEGYLGGDVSPPWGTLLEDTDVDEESGRFLAAAVLRPDFQDVVMFILIRKWLCV